MRYRLKVSRERAVEFRKEKEASVKNEEKVVEEVNREIKRNNLLVDELTNKDEETAELKRQMKVLDAKLLCLAKKFLKEKKDRQEVQKDYAKAKDLLKEVKDRYLEMVRSYMGHFTTF